MRALILLLFLALAVSCKEDPVPPPDPRDELVGRYWYTPYYYHEDLTPHAIHNNTWDIVQNGLDFQKSTNPGEFSLRLHSVYGIDLDCDSMTLVSGGYTFKIPQQTADDTAINGIFSGVANIDHEGAKHEGVIIPAEKHIKLLLRMPRGSEIVILAVYATKSE